MAAGGPKQEAGHPLDNLMLLLGQLKALGLGL
jgi:hypothetical protein